MADMYVFAGDNYVIPRRCSIALVRKRLHATDMAPGTEPNIV